MAPTNSINVYPNLEAIAEFKVLTSNYGAQYGKNGSGTVEVETKSGTNQFHGSAFYYGRNDFFNANSWQDNGTGVARPAYKKHDWGYTVGGPVYIPHLYNNDKRNFLFLVPGMASRNCTRAKYRSGSSLFRRAQGQFQRRLPGVYRRVICSQRLPSLPLPVPANQGCPSLTTPCPRRFRPPQTRSSRLSPAANNFNGIAGTYPSGQGRWDQYSCLRRQPQPAHPLARGVDPCGP